LLLSSSWSWASTSPIDSSAGGDDAPADDFSFGHFGDFTGALGPLVEGWWPMTSSPTAGFTGRAAALPDHEQLSILDVAATYDVDPVMLAAIRIAENGGAGREFGVLSVPAPTYYDQARVAAQSIRANYGRFIAATGQAPTDAAGRVTRAFVDFMSARWAPIGAANDPTGLNAHWAGNVWSVVSSSGLA
jgi:hypothetical protein